MPKLVAADLEHGWLVTEFIPGNDLNGVCSELPCEGFSSLALGLVELEEVFASEWESLQLGP